MTIHAKWKAWPNQARRRTYRRRASVCVDGRRRASTDVDALGVNGPLVFTCMPNLHIHSVLPSETGKKDGWEYRWCQGAQNIVKLNPH